MPEGALRSFRDGCLNRIRRDQPKVFWPKPGIRFGNLLYLWMQAHMERRQGVDAWVLGVDAARGWRGEFPKIFEDLDLPRARVRFRYQRVMGLFQAFNYHYSERDVAEFCNEYILHAPGITRFKTSAEERGLGRRDVVTVNVRRGDYYSVPEHKRRYGFDVRGFVLEALKRQQNHAAVKQVFLVSDDIPWCVANLGPSLQQMGVSFAYCNGADGARDFAHLGLSQRLILANSTFSYWGGLVATARDQEAHIVAPWFHARDWLDGKSFHLHPAWSVVEGFHDVEDSA